MKAIVLSLLLLVLPSGALADTSDRESALSVYRAFSTRLSQATAVSDVTDLLSETSPLRAAAGDERRASAFQGFQEMLSRFRENEVSVDVDGDAAQVVARGHAPVDDPQIRRFIATAAATYRVSLVKEGGHWKVDSTSYKIRHSD